MAMARWILILVVVVATVGVGAHVGEITEHRAGHDVGDQWRVGGGLTTGQQRQFGHVMVVGGWWLVVDNRVFCVSLARCGCLFLVFEIQQRTKYSQIPLRMES
jgi:hypothetical protein